MLKPGLPAFFCIAAFQALSQINDEVHSPPFTAEHAEVVRTLLSSLEIPLAAESIIDNTPEWQKWCTVDNYAFGKNRGSMAMITDLDALHPYFRSKIVALIEVCRSKGIKLAIVETYRTRAKQNEYKSMGRIYTRSNGGRSKHQYGLAIDVVPIVGDSATWHDPVLWKKIGTAGERLGLRWGGRWRHPYDPGHFEWTGGLNSTLLANGMLPNVPNGHDFPCLDEDLTALKESWEAWEAEQSTAAKTIADSKLAME